MKGPETQTPEEWEEQAVEWDLKAIQANPHPQADQARRVAIRQQLYAAVPPGRRPSPSDWLRFMPELNAMKERQWAGARARRIAAMCRDYAVLSGILRATEAAG